jgi:hypothetical protein
MWIEDMHMVASERGRCTVRSLKHCGLALDTWRLRHSF